jgi:glutamate---cysteine ligase / carboxylate-amine ligase
MQKKKINFHLSWCMQFMTTTYDDVHVGMPSADQAVEIMGRLKPYLLILLALSASSPF